MPTKNRKLICLYIIFLSTLVVFPLGQLLKLSLSAQIKVALLDLLLFLFIILGFANGFNINKNSKASLKYPGLLFIFFSFFSLVIASFKIENSLILQGFLYLIRFAIYFLFYLQLHWFFAKFKKKRKIINQGLTIAGSLVAIIGIIQYFLYPDLRNLLYLGWDPHYYRLFSTFFDPNFTGLILVLTLIQFIFLDFKKNTKSKIAYQTLFFITATALILTKSRSAFISLLIGLLVLFFTEKKIKKEHFLLTIIAFIIVFLLPKPKVDVFSLFRLDSSLARVNNWKQSLKLGLINPLFGQGFGVWRFPDSSFLYVWVGTGLSGFLFFVLMFIRIFKLALVKKGQLLVSVAVVFISSWFNNTIFYPWILYWLFLLLAKED